MMPKGRRLRSVSGSSVQVPHHVSLRLEEREDGSLAQPAGGEDGVEVAGGLRTEGGMVLQAEPTELNPDLGFLSAHHILSPHLASPLSLPAVPFYR